MATLQLVVALSNLSSLIAMHVDTYGIDARDVLGREALCQWASTCSLGVQAWLIDTWARACRRTANILSSQAELLGVGGVFVGYLGTATVASVLQ